MGGHRRTSFASTPVLITKLGAIYSRRPRRNWYSVIVSLDTNGTGPSIGAYYEEILAMKYEYKFVRLGEGWMGAKREAQHQYQEQVHQHAHEGWRLVQVFAPGLGVYGMAKYIELIFEREVSG
jgi:hypothetical protein